MEEIEIKILDINKEEVIKKLIELGAEKVFEGEVKADYFDFEDERLKKEEKILRLRKKGDKVELALKKKISMEQAKIMKEDEIVFDDHDAAEEILNGLGLKKIVEALTKQRVSYSFDDVLFEFDTYTGIPTFLEIEAPTLEKLKEAVERIGFSMEDTKAWDAKQVIEHYNQ